LSDDRGGSRPLPEDLFNDALERPPSERAAFLDAACAGDPALREELARLLALAERDPSLTAPPAAAAPPERLGKYELLEEIGRGGMGVVYAARDVQLGRVVALKLLPAWLAADRRARERFVREAQLLASLSDERIATLYSLDEADGRHFLTMELIPGRTLADRLREGPLPLEEALAFGRQVAEAVARAHERHVVHRDLKPANLMLTPGGGAKILDFGIARALWEGPAADRPPDAAGEGLTRAQGTPGYMAPEQLAGGPVDERCDVWALGCVVFEALSGRPAVAVLDERGRLDPRALPAGLPRHVPAVLQRCLERDPRRRDVSAAQLAQALQRALAGRRSGRRRLAAAAGLAALAVLAGATLLLGPRGPLRRPAPARALATVEIADDRIVRARDAAGELLWAHALPAPIAGADRGPELSWLVDAPKLLSAGDRVRGVCVATASERPGEPGAVWLLSPRDGEPLWRWSAAWQRPVNAHGTLRVEWTALLPWPGRAEPAVVAELWDGGWYGAALQFLDAAGRPLGAYLHPGPLLPGQVLAADGDRPLRYAFAGTNSSARFVRALVPFDTREHVGCVVLLEPPEVAGQGFPYSEGLPEPRDWPGLPRARERSYLAIPPVHPEHGSLVVSFAQNRDEQGRPSFTALTKDGRYYFLDEDLRPRSCYVRTKSAADSLVARGEARFLPLMLIRDGVTSWVDVPPTY